MDRLRQNLADLLAKHGVNPTALSKATGVPQPTIHRILTGDSDDPRTNTLRPLADYFGVTVEQLRNAYPVGAAPLPLIAGDVEPAPYLRSFKHVPVVGTVQGGPDGFLEALGHTESDEVIEYPAGNKSTYALRVRGESMRPRIKSGEFIVVEPNTQPHPGDDVVVICHDGRKMVKELLYIRDGEITLGSIHNGFKPISLQMADVEAIHYVAAIVPRGAFHRA